MTSAVAPEASAMPRPVMPDKMIAVTGYSRKYFLRELFQGATAGDPAFPETPMMGSKGRSAGYPDAGYDVFRGKAIRKTCNAPSRSDRHLGLVFIQPVKKPADQGE